MYSWLHAFMIDNIMNIDTLISYYVKFGQDEICTFALLAARPVSAHQPCPAPDPSHSTHCLTFPAMTDPAFEAVEGMMAGSASRSATNGCHQDSNLEGECGIGEAVCGRLRDREPASALQEPEKIPGLRNDTEQFWYRRLGCCYKMLTKCH